MSKKKVKDISGEFVDIRKYKHEVTRKLPKDLRELADSAIDHIGSILDNSKIEDFVKIAPSLFCGYMGYKAFNNWEGMGFGLVALELAKAEGVPSQTIGLGMLATIGISALAGKSIPDAVSDIIGEPIATFNAIQKQSYAVQDSTFLSGEEKSLMNVYRTEVMIGRRFPADLEALTENYKTLIAERIAGQEEEK